MSVAHASAFPCIRFSSSSPLFGTNTCIFVHAACTELATPSRAPSSAGHEAHTKNAQRCSLPDAPLAQIRSWTQIFGLATDCMSRYLLVRCNGLVTQEWHLPRFVFNELHNCPFWPHKRKVAEELHVEDGASQLFNAFKESISLKLLWRPIPKFQEL